LGERYLWLTIPEFSYRPGYAVLCAAVSDPDLVAVARSIPLDGKVPQAVVIHVALEHKRLISAG